MNSPPTTLGKYQIIREIARSNDIVYEAYDPLMNRRVAIKELAVPKGSAPQQQEERVKRFEREVRAAGSLSHPNVVTIYEFGADQGRHFMAMEYLDGRTLRNELDTHGFLAPLRALAIAAEVLEALAYAHKHGVVHRDIKPENIQLLENDKVKITDFGIARLTFEPSLTMDGQVFGTPSYMSPEQIVGRDIDARSDIFSLGVVLYEMIAGGKPFHGDSVVTISYSIMNSAPPQPRQAGYGVWRIVERAIDKSPAMRWASAEEMLAAIRAEQAAIQAGSIVATSPAPPVPGFQLPQAPSAYQPMPAACLQPPPQPAAVYPANPFAGGAYQPYTGAYGQPPNQAPGNMGYPIYYPPPRPPLVSPATRMFLGRLFLTLLVLGTLFGLVLAGIQALTIAMSRLAAAAAGVPHQTQPQPLGPAPRQPLFAPEPEALDRATAPDLAAPATDPAHGEPLRAAYDPATAQALLQEAYAHIYPGKGRRPNLPEARRLLYEARRMAPPGTELAGRIEEALERLTTPRRR
jgi:serine/threonine-protein kinase